jgi:DNA mismatch endonuclease (patch repair protein)
MTDRLTPAQRHLVMSHIRSRNTKPELKVRQWLWRHGYRYRLNVKSVPGKPDIVMRKYHTAIFVNGCFWHGHQVTWSPDESLESVESLENKVESSRCCKIPQTNREFWVNKIKRNQERDQQNYQLLIDNGWLVIVIWECQLKPKRIEQTMTEVELLLNEKLLSLYNKHKPFYYHTEEESPLPMAAEELQYQPQ